MDSIQQVKARIESIAGTRQITQSMRLVATARLRRVRERLDGNRAFLAGCERMVRDAAADGDTRGHRYVEAVARKGAGDPKGGSAAGGAACVIVVGADRGLCGGYNTNVCREAHGFIRETGVARLVTVGQKAKDYFVRRLQGGETIARSYTGMSETPFFEDAEEIAALALQWYDRGEIDSIHLVYTHFNNMLSLIPTRRLLLPVLRIADIPPAAAVETGFAPTTPTTAGDSPAGAGQTPAGGGARVGETPAAANVRRAIRFEPGSRALLDRAVPFYLAAALLGALLESSVCEQCARVSSMDSAVRNSDGMIGVLTMQYNKARQAAITGELADIIGGVAAIRRKPEKED